MNIGQIYWLVLGLVLSGMLVGAFFSGRESLRRQVADEVPGLNKRELRSASARVRSGWWANWLQGVSTEMVGAVVMTILLGTVVGAVQQQQLIAQQKQELISQLGSPDNAFAIEATRILRARGWGFGEETTLQGAFLEGADLQGANLWHANLQGANLYRASLQGTYLHGANLQGANLLYANLHGARHLKVEQLRQAEIFGRGNSTRRNKAARATSGNNHF